MRIWDVLMVDGCAVLFRFAVALFSLHESRLLSCSDAGSLYECVSELGQVRDRKVT